MRMARARRAAWLVLAVASLGIGLVGVVLPVLPTTPFVLLAAFAADRGSPRLHGWLMRHAVFGPVIRDWRASGAVSRRAKVVAVAAMAVSVAVMLLTAPPVLAVPASVVVAGVAVWLWRRPEPRPAGGR
jgi:uncharacterized membrane protein YbaN (DUF454 family)